jgi:hypothetical protein
MILKKLGLATLNSLHMVVLFSADCNYIFKHSGREMIRNVEQAKALAPKQYGS